MNDKITLDYINETLLALSAAATPPVHPMTTMLLDLTDSLMRRVKPDAGDSEPDDTCLCVTCRLQRLSPGLKASDIARARCFQFVSGLFLAVATTPLAEFPQSMSYLSGLLSEWCAKHAGIADVLLTAQDPVKLATLVVESMVTGAMSFAHVYVVPHDDLKPVERDLKADITRAIYKMRKSAS